MIFHEIVEEWFKNWIGQQLDETGSGLRSMLTDCPMMGSRHIGGCRTEGACFYITNRTRKRRLCCYDNADKEADYSTKVNVSTDDITGSSITADSMIVRIQSSAESSCLKYLRRKKNIWTNSATYRRFGKGVQLSVAKDNDKENLIRTNSELVF